MWQPLQKNAQIDTTSHIMKFIWHKIKNKNLN